MLTFSFPQELIQVVMHARLIDRSGHDLTSWRFAGWMDWLLTKCRKSLKHLSLNQYIMMRVIWSSTAALGSCPGIVLLFILHLRYVAFSKGISLYFNVSLYSPSLSWTFFFLVLFHFLSPLFFSIAVYWLFFLDSICLCACVQEPAFQRLLFITMLAWENPYSKEPAKDSTRASFKVHS